MNAAEVLAHGYPSPQIPPVTPMAVLSSWDTDVFLTLGLLTVAALYLTGVLRLARRGGRWPVGRTGAFLAGVGSAAYATMSWLGTYDTTLFWVHTIQHMVLVMLTPVFLALGAPVTLALRTLPPRPRKALLRVLHSRPARVLASPLLTFPLFITTLFALYFTGWYEATLTNTYLHEMQHVHFVLVGCLFFWPILGIDPLPGQIPYLARLGLLLLSMPAHIIVGLSIMQQVKPIAAGYYDALDLPWAPDPLRDQYIGGGILWATGDFFSGFYAAVLLVQWFRAEDRQARRHDRHHDRLERQGRSGESELGRYNDYLGSLQSARRVPRQGGNPPTGAELSSPVGSHSTPVPPP